MRAQIVPRARQPLVVDERIEVGGAEVLLLVKSRTVGLIGRHPMPPQKFGPDRRSNSAICACWRVTVSRIADTDARSSSTSAPSAASVDVDPPRPTIDPSTRAAVAAAPPS